MHKLPSQKDFLNIKVLFTTVFIEVFFYFNTGRS